MTAKTDLKSQFTATQLRRIMDTRRVRDEVCTGQARFTHGGRSYVIRYGIKSRTVHAVHAA